MSVEQAIQRESPPAAGVSPWTCAACVVALVAGAGTLYLSMGMGLKACPFCLYQRAFLFGALGVLVVGLLTGGGRPGFVSLLAIPAAAGGLTVAGFHVYLEANGALECPLGVAGLGSAPQQSLAAFALLFALLLLDVVCGGSVGGFALPAPMGAALLGVLFGVGCIFSAPPPPPVPPNGYPPGPPDGCRPASPRR
ncbi:MAG: disulfide bond formation protein B [Gemmataceae bacterium]|nr:disulfide bond formation protein B [Gemmataceae bacterium]